MQGPTHDLLSIWKGIIYLTVGGITVDLNRKDIFVLPGPRSKRDKDRIIMVKVVEELGQMGRVGRFREMCNVPMCDVFV